MRFFLISLHFLLLCGAALAQIPGIGIGWLINPEGSRLFPQPIIYPRHAGKPDPRWKVFDWHYRDFKTERTPWRLYFYDVGSRERSFWTAEYAAPVIDAQVRELAARFNYWPQEPFSYILFSSYREFQQANVFFIEEGVQGITSTQEPTMAIPYWGERETFRHISHHELVHQFQVQKLKSLASGTPIEARPIPLWMIEGMAEYYSLKGVDSESLALLRDLYFNFPDQKRDLLDLLAPGPMDFQHVYKLGQLKIAFLEEEWGSGTLQRIFESCGARLGSVEAPTLEAVLTRQLGLPIEQIQARWGKYLDRRLSRGFENNTGTEAFTQVSSVGTTLDHYVVSPSGDTVLWREVDALTGGTSLRVGSFNARGEVIESKEVTHDRQSSAVSLYFFQVPSLALARGSLAFIASTASGPELELRTYKKQEHQRVEMGDGGRIRLHEYGLVQAHSPSFDPTETRLAFVGIDSKGWQNVYVVDRDTRGAKKRGTPVLRQLTRGAFAWKNLCWTHSGILAATDQDSPSGLYGIRLLDPISLGSKVLVEPSLGFENLLEPVAIDPEREIFLRSTNGRGQQIYRWTPMRGLEPLTRIRTMMLQPQLSGAGVHALAFQKGRFHLVRIARTPDGRGPASPQQKVQWDSTEVTPFAEGSVQRYRPFKGTGVRVDDFGAFFSSGAILGLSGTFSDLMRNDIVSADLLAISGLGVTQADVFWTSEEGRATWTLGAYHLRTRRIDRDHIESGALGAYQYPLGPYSSGTAVLRAGRIEQPGATSWMVAPSLSWGVDHVEYELFSGPIKGFGWLIEAGTEFFPSLGTATERLRLDASHYIKLWGRSLLATHLMAGHAFTLSDRGPGSVDLHNPFYVSSDDMFRAYSFDDDRLRGDSLLGVKTELRFPLGEAFGFEPLRGILAADIGSIWGNHGPAPQTLASGVSSSWSSGFCFNIPPLGFSFLFSRPIRVAPDPTGRPMDSSVFHFTLRYLYL